MERQKRSEMTGIGILVIFHLVGLIGFHIEKWTPLFERLVPFNLLLSVAVLTYFHTPKNKKWLFFASVVVLVGFGIEVLGVQTGKIFGVYAYDYALGPKIAKTPPMIGVNWLMLVYAVGMTATIFTQSTLYRVLLGTTIMVLLDLLIEPMAIDHHLWRWEQVAVPLQNYIAWGFCSAMFMLFFHLIYTDEYNPIALPFVIVQLLFFGTYNLLNGISLF